jgi:hypothetical protein
MIASLNFPRSATEDKRLWDILNQNTILKSFTPVITDFTGATTPTILQGYYQLYGPMVFIFVHIKNDDPFGWDGGATVEVPIGPYVPVTGTFPQVINPVVDVTTSLSVNNEHPSITVGTVLAGKITLSTALSSTGGPTEILLSGSYLRNASKGRVPVPI